MALATLELSARRAAVLLRCQKLREQRCRRDASRAELGSTAAAAAERRAQSAVSSGRLADAEQLRRACDDLGGKMVRPEQLATVPALEQALAQQAEQRDQALAAATEAARVARATADAAREALLAERRATEKREQLNLRAQTLWRHTVDVIEELERDDQVADTWRSA